MANNSLEISLALKNQGFKAEINNIKKDNQLLRAEFEKLASSVDDFENSLEGKQAKLKLVTKEYENAKKTVDIYKKQVEEAREAVESANEKLQAQGRTINNIKEYIEQYKDATGAVGESVAKYREQLEELEKEYAKQAKAVVSANTQYQKMQTDLAKAETSVNNLGRELKDCADDVYKFDGKLENLENQLESVDKDLDRVGDSASNFASNMSNIGQGLMDVGDKLGQIGQKGLSVIGGFVSKGAEWSAQVAGQQFIYDTLDESIQKTIDSLSENSKVIGLTNQQYKNSATSMANFYKNMGYTTEETTKLTGETMNLVADLAAVNDIPFDDAMDRFKSGLMGEHSCPTIVEIQYM